MKKALSTQWMLMIAIVVIGGAILGAEYYLVKWLPGHRERLREEVLKPVPYKNDKLGFEAEIAAGLTGKIEEFPGGVRIFKPETMSLGPSVTFTARPNPEGTFEFSPQELARWQTDDIYLEIPRYSFQQVKINNRSAVLIEQFKDRAMQLTARVMSSERILEMTCTPGQADEALYMQACHQTARSIKVAGPEPPPPPPTVYELIPPSRSRR
jgi:hypothetical protein